MFLRGDSPIRQQACPNGWSDKGAGWSTRFDFVAKLWSELNTRSYKERNSLIENNFLVVTLLDYYFFEYLDILASTL